MITCIGDLHIDALDKYIPDAYKKILSTFDRVVQREIDNGASHIIQLGDSFNSPYPEQYHVTDYIKSLKKVSVPLTILMGNHDFADVRNNSLRFVSFLCKTGFINGSVVKKPEIVKIDGDKYFFCPHPYIMDQPKGVRYSFGHFGYDGAKGDNGYSIKSGNSPRGRWILGDYHTPQKGKNFIYAGSLCQVKWHESTDKAYIRLDETPKLISVQPDILLDRASIDSMDDLNRLSPSSYWSVNISRKVKLPPDWASKYPHIVRHHTEKSSSKRAKILMKQVASDDPLSGLGDYLREEGLSDKEVKIAFKKLGRKERV